jgi:hypothetical protein
MKRERTTKHEIEGKLLLELSLDENRRRFVESLSVRARVQTLDVSPLAKQFRRSLAFSNRVARRHKRSLGANYLDFIQSRFAHKLQPADDRVESASMIYKSLGGPIATELYSLLAEFSLCLNISHSTHRFDIQAAHSYAFQLNAAAQQSKLLERQTITDISKSTKEIEHRTELKRATEVERSTFISQQARREMSARSESHGFVPSLIFFRNEVKDVHPLQANIQTGATVKSTTTNVQAEAERILKNLDRTYNSTQSYMIERAIKTTRKEAFAQLKYFRALPPDRTDEMRSAVAALYKQAFISSQPSHARARASIQNIVPPSSKPASNQTVEFKGSPGLQLPLARSRGQEPSEGILSPNAREARLAAPEIIAFISGIENHRQSPDDRQPRNDWPSLLVRNRLTQFTRIAELKKTILSGAPSLAVRGHLAPMAAAYDNEGVDRAIHNLTAVRRGEMSEAPLLRYELVQPARPIAEEHKVIKKVDNKEVIALIKKEVQGMMGSGSAMMKFSRTDYEQIADKIYSSLVRRLVVEKERLGLR